MFSALGLVARNATRKAARKAGLGLAAGLCLLTGAGFLVSAGWIALAAAKGGLFASLMIGLAFAGVGLVLVAAAAARRPEAPAPAALDDETLAALSQAATGAPGDLERAMRGLLAQAGLPPPATGGAPALLAAFVFGLTLALSRRRKP